MYVRGDGNDELFGYLPTYFGGAIGADVDHGHGGRAGGTDCGEFPPPAYAVTPTNRRPRRHRPGRDRRTTPAAHDEHHLRPTHRRRTEPRHGADQTEPPTTERPTTERLPPPSPGDQRPPNDDPPAARSADPPRTRRT
jgi:hypothetical protein